MQHLVEKLNCGLFKAQSENQSLPVMIINFVGKIKWQ